MKDKLVGLTVCEFVKRSKQETSKVITVVVPPCRTIFDFSFLLAKFWLRVMAKY